MNRILVAEDEPGIALALEDCLRLEGFQVDVVSDGAVASQCARDGAFDLLLLDVMLPGKDGFAICRELRSAGSRTPVIFLSARAQESDRICGLDLGANDYVVKPFSPGELMARVRRVLRDHEDGRGRHKRFEDELQAAAAVQQGLFPQHHPVVESLEYSAACRPARVVSGDYYDFIPLDRGKIGFLLADVCGKGMGAALVGASLHGALRAFAPLASSRCGDLLQRVNRLLFQTTSAERYATAFYGVFDPATCKLRYTNAGHYAPWLIRGAGWQRLESLTPPLGMFPSVDSLEVEVQLEGGDWLVAASDGVAEATDEHGEDFGDVRLLGLLDTSDMTTEVFCRAALDAVNSFAGNQQADDVTIMAARILPANAS
jgi:sigma-B regulation protein RsbU (phosphoserine phosphatase)